MRYAASTTVLGVALLVSASALSGWMTWTLSEDPVRSVPSFAEGVEVEARAAGIPVATTAEVERMLEEGSHLFLDARELEAYDENHVPTAFSLPIRDFESKFPEIAPLLEADTPLLVYCGGPTCDDGLRLALRLREAGYGGAVLYVGGMEAWEARDGE